MSKSDNTADRCFVPAGLVTPIDGMIGDGMIGDRMIGDGTIDDRTIGEARGWFAEE
jgi:hypothetical protein